MRKCVLLLTALTSVMFCSVAEAKAFKLNQPLTSKSVQLARDVVNTPRTDSFSEVSTAPLTVDATSPKSGDFVSTIVKKINALNDKIVADIDVANAMASETDPDTGRAKDEIAAACYPAAKKFIISLKATVPDGGVPGVVTLFERKRLLVLTIKKGLPTYLTLGCAPLLGDEIKILVGVVGMAGINLIVPGGGLAALATKLPVLGLGL